MGRRPPVSSNRDGITADYRRTGKNGGETEEVEIELKKRIAVNATLRSRIAALPGVMSVEAV